MFRSAEPEPHRRPSSRIQRLLPRKEVMRMARRGCGCRTRPRGPKVVRVRPFIRRKPRKC